MIEIEPGTSDLITTNLDRTYMPVIRMKTGDRAKPVAGRCECGRTVRTIRLMGRSHGPVKIGGQMFEPDLILKIVEEMGMVHGEWQACMMRNGSGQDALEIRLVEALEDVCRDLLGRLLQQAPILAKQVAEGGIAGVKIVSVPSADGLRTASGKHRTFIDLR